MFEGDPLAGGGRAGGGLGAGHLRGDGRARAERCPPGGADADRLSRRLLAAARPADQDPSEGPLARRPGFEVVEPRDSHLCCGSAGTYNLMQPAISAELKARKVATLAATGKPQAIAAGNIGCMMQIGSATPGAGRAHRRASGLGDGRPAAPGASSERHAVVRNRRKSGISGFQGGSGMRAYLASIGGLLAAAIALPASAQESLHPSVLAGHAVLPALSLIAPPADAPRDAWISGKFTGPARNEMPMSAPGDTGPMHGHRPTGLSLPFIGQPLQGISGLAMIRALDGSCLRADRQRLRGQAQQRRRAAHVHPPRAGLGSRPHRGRGDRVPRRPGPDRGLPPRPRGQRRPVPDRRRLRSREHPGRRRRQCDRRRVRPLSDPRHPRRPRHRRVRDDARRRGAAEPRPSVRPGPGRGRNRLPRRAVQRVRGHGAEPRRRAGSGRCSKSRCSGRTAPPRASSCGRWSSILPPAAWTGAELRGPCPKARRRSGISTSSTNAGH